MFRKCGLPSLWPWAVLLATGPVLAQAPVYSYRRDSFRDPVMLGRGNAGIATIDEGVSAFYNPAGLARTDSFRIQFADAMVAGNSNFKSSYTEIMNIGDEGETLAEKLSPFLGKPLSIQGSVFPHVSAPGLLFGGWDYLDSALEYRDPVNPVLSTDIRNDYGLIFGAAKKIGDYIYVGSSIRYIRRRHVLEEITAGSLVVDANEVMDNLQANGEGWGLTVGSQFVIPVGEKQELSLAAVIEDVGQTRFKNNDRTLVVPLKQYQFVNFGASYGARSALADFTLSVDMRNALDDSGLSYTKRLHMGVEVGLPAIDLRAGLFQGYWTAGFSIHVVPLLTIHAATYAEELGVIAGQRSNRYYMLGVRLGTELKAGQGNGKKKPRFSLDKL